MSIVPIRLDPASGAKLVMNGLVASPTLDDLDSDLVLVELPGDRYIDVSWYPENDQPGAYFVTRFHKGDWENPEYTFQAPTPQAAAFIVEVLATEHSQDVGPVACSSGSTSEFHYPTTSAA
jgi:hypothetical protein